MRGIDNLIEKYNIYASISNYNNSSLKLSVIQNIWNEWKSNFEINLLLHSE